MDKRELRLAIQAKLEHRRELIGLNSTLRQDLHREKKKNRFLVETLANPLVDMILEDCADQIMRAIIEQSVRASSVVAEETLDGEDFDIGISIPSLYIRHRIHRMDLLMARDMPKRDREVRRVNVCLTPPKK